MDTVSTHSDNETWVIEAGRCCHLQEGQARYRTVNFAGKSPMIRSKFSKADNVAMEQKEELIQWLPVPSFSRSINRLLPDDWAAAFEVKVADSSFTGKGFRFHFEEVLAVRPANESLRLLLAASDTLCARSR